MGSRGQALKTGGFMHYGYHTIMRDGNIRFVVQNDTIKSSKIPEVSNSPNVVYATLNRDGFLQGISFYDAKRIKRREIDFKVHNGMNPHVHTLDTKIGLRDDSLTEVRPLDEKEKKYAEKIQQFCKEHNLYQKAKRK